MPKSKYSPEFRATVSQEYLDGKGSMHFIANKHGIAYSTLKDWVNLYKIQGIVAFEQQTIGNRNYSKELKIKCVEAVINREGSVDEITAQYGISSATVLRGWIKVYNANKELKDYNPSREVYMADARRKTTLEERIEIVNYCITNNRNYKETALKYDVSYSQVYSWIQRYDADGDDGLLDKRGQHKSDDEVDELERLRRENLRLKRQLEEKDMAVELLKKVKEFERM